MAEYIDREALYDFKDELMSEFIELCRGNDYNKLTLLKIGDTVDKISEKYCTKPAADVAEVKHGYWKDTEYGTCSVCDRSISEIYDADSHMAYGILDELTACPFCGAKMDGE